MGNENGEWIMRGVGEDDPACIRTAKELTDYINAVGFLPLFRNDVPGFSVEEHTSPYHWWTDDALDPWQWRMILAREHKVAYGKFFDKKAGFISLEWLPRFINYRRDGYDFDARWDDEKASYRCKHVMDLFPGDEELFSYEIKAKAGFGRDGDKGFEGTLTLLQMQTYLAMSDFRCRLNRAGEPYGWNIALYSTPESLWGSELVTAAYGEAPEDSFRLLWEHAQKLWPGGDEKALRKMLK